MFLVACAGVFIVIIINDYVLIQSDTISPLGKNPSVLGNSLFWQGFLSKMAKLCSVCCTIDIVIRSPSSAMYSIDHLSQRTIAIVDPTRTATHDADNADHGHNT
jgi:hypothetical protein